MAITVTGTPTTGDGVRGSTSVVLNVPTGAVAGELLVAWISGSASTGTITAPTGFTVITQGHDNGSGAPIDNVVQLAYRVVDGTEAASYTWTFQSGSVYPMATMFRVAGVNTTGPTRAVATQYTNTKYSSFDTGPSLTGVLGTDAELYLFSLSDDSGTNIGAYTGPGSPWATVASRALYSKGQFITYSVGANAAPTVSLPSANSQTIWAAVAVAFVSSGAADTTPPTVPTGVTATANSTSQVTVAWTASTDANGVASYRVQRGGTTIAAAVTGTSYVDTTVAPSTAYSYTVSAVDPSGNRSAESTAATVTTPAGTPATLVISPAVDLTTTPPRVRLTINDNRTSPAYSLTIIRNNGDGTTSTVRTSDGNPLALTSSGAGTSALLDDYEAPYGQSVTYSAQEVAGTVSGSVTVDPGVVWLIHPGVPSMSLQLLLREGSLTQNTYTASRGVYYVMGRANPVVQTDNTRHGATGSMTALTTTTSALSALMTLLSSSSVLLLNIPTSKGWTFPTRYVSVGDVKTQPAVGSKIIDSYVDVAMAFDVVDAPIGGTQAQRTYVDLLTYPTYTALDTAYVSYTALQAGP